jgi:hypothetical protein
MAEKTYISGVGGEIVTTWDETKGVVIEIVSTFGQIWNLGVQIGKLTVSLVPKVGFVVAEWMEVLKVMKVAAPVPMVIPPPPVPAPENPPAEKKE